MAKSNKISIERGLPQQASAIYPLLFQTAPKNISYIFGDSIRVDKRITEECWKRVDTTYSHKFSHVAIQHGQVIGVLVAFDGKTYKEQQKITSQVAAQYIDDSLMQHMKKAMPEISLLSPQIPNRTYYIHYISVSDNAQGKGVGKLLLECAFDQAKATKCHSLSLDVSIDNPAVEFYKVMGLDIIVETRVPLLSKKANISGSYRMVKRLI